MPINFPNNPILNQYHITIDNKRYVFDGVKWGFDISSFSEKCHTGSAAPVDPSSGDLWWDSTNGTLFVYYTDVNGSQWVSAVPVGDSSGLPDQSGANGKYLRTDGTSVYWGWATLPGIAAPTVTVTGTEVSDDGIITITGSAFTVNEGEDVHASTDWRIVRDSDGATVWESLDDAANLTTVGIPASTLSSDSTVYVRYRGENFGYSEWTTESFHDASLIASGGIISYTDDRVYHTFTESDVLAVTSPGFANIYMISGGGGGGGAVASPYLRGGGGGGGGAISEHHIFLAAGSYTAIVGAGGAAGSGTDHGSNGGASSFENLSVVGGGAGSAGGSGVVGFGGACGGGAGSVYRSVNLGGIGSLGGDGGDSSTNTGGGGGGASTNASGSNPGAGIDGNAGGGGGGGQYVTSGIDGGGNSASGTIDATPGIVNTGGGGGGGSEYTGTTRSAGNGGSGIVIVWYTQ